MTLVAAEPKIELGIAAEEIVEFLKGELKIQEAYHNILCQRIIQNASQQRGLTVTSEEVQAQADTVRRENQLEKAEDTLAWLSQQMVTPDEWETGIVNNLLRQKLAHEMFAEKVEKFFAQNRVKFEQVLLYQIVVADENLAWELYHQIQEEEISFYLAAKIYDIEESRRYQCGYEGRLYRWKIRPEISPTIFAAETHVVTPPLMTEQGSHLFWVEDCIPAQLTSEIRDEILKQMFDEWLMAEYTYLLLNADTTQKDKGSN